MTSAHRITGSGRGQGILRAATLAAILAAAAPAGAQTGGASPEIAVQKATMLEGFFSSGRLQAARAANPMAVAPLEKEAHESLDAGRAALEGGQVATALEHFDAGIRAISEAVALGSKAAAPSKQALSSDFVNRRRHAEAYIVTLESSEDISDQTRGKVRHLRGDLDRADDQFEAGSLREATTTLDEAYASIIALIGDVRRGHTSFVSRTFETPEEEFEYERERNHSYDLLVDIALAEHGEKEPGLVALAERLRAESSRLRDQAEQESAAGDPATAIRTMELSTERLLPILRASGLIVME